MVDLQEIIDKFEMYQDVFIGWVDIANKSHQGLLLDISGNLIHVREGKTAFTVPSTAVVFCRTSGIAKGAEYQGPKLKYIVTWLRFTRTIKAHNESGARSAFIGSLVRSKSISREQASELNKHASRVIGVQLYKEF